MIPQKANTDETGIIQTCAVGIFLDGASPFGVMDMSGNLWEWCLNDYQSPEIIAGVGYIERKVLRGGSFDLDYSYTTTIYRYSRNPYYGNYFYGLRLVCCARG